MLQKSDKLTLMNNHVAPMSCDISKIFKKNQCILNLIAEIKSKKLQLNVNLRSSPCPVP